MNKLKYFFRIVGVVIRYNLSLLGIWSWDEEEKYLGLNAYLFSRHKVPPPEGLREMAQARDGMRQLSARMRQNDDLNESLRRAMEGFIASSTQPTTFTSITTTSVHNISPAVDLNNISIGDLLALADEQRRMILASLSEAHLDEIGSLYGVVRAVGESRDSFASRIHALLLAISSGYIRRATAPPSLYNCLLSGSDTNPKPSSFLFFERYGKRAYLDFDGKELVFGGDMRIGSAAKEFFNFVSHRFAADYKKKEAKAIKQKVGQMLEIEDVESIHSYIKNDQGEDLICFTEKNAVQLFVKFAEWLRGGGMENKIRIGGGDGER